MLSQGQGEEEKTGASNYKALSEPKLKCQQDCKLKSKANSSSKSSQRLFPKAKGKNDAYNEAYRYLKFRNRPAKQNSEKLFHNWRKNIEKAYYLSESPKV